MLGTLRLVFTWMLYIIIVGLGLLSGMLGVLLKDWRMAVASLSLAVIILPEIAKLVHHGKNYEMPISGW